MAIASSIDWRAIHDVVLEIGRADDEKGVFSALFSKIGSLVPHDFAHLVFLGPKDPDRFGRPYGIIDLQARDIPSPHQERYPYYFERTDLRPTVIPGRQALFSADEARFVGTEFGEDWCRPVRARYSTGIRFLDGARGLLGLLILYRERGSAPFSPLEMDSLEAVQAHTMNLARPRRRLSLEAGRESRLAVLSKREREVAYLLGRGLRTKAIAARLGIEESTAYRHVHHIFGKLGIENRQELTALITREGG